MELKWGRLSGLFGECQLVLGRCEDIEVYRAEGSYGSEGLAGAMNAVRGNAQLFEKMF